MVNFGVTSTLLTAATLLSVVSATLDPIVIKGSKFFLKTSGAQFYIKGVAYQQDSSAGGATSSNVTFVDPLADSASCTRDVPLLKALGTNVIRTYAIDPTADHTTCMALLDAAGIYVITDLSQPSASIDRSDPQWNTALYSRYTSVIDTMQQYSNVIGFFAGNEVTNAANNTGATAMVKASVRDMKAYIKSKGYRAMGVGYATNDDATTRQNLADYLNCGDQSAAIDFWGYNIYEWCGQSSYTLSGYDQRTAEFSNYSVPSFFAEYGCNTPGGAAARPFTEVAALYGTNMSSVFSGGIVYMYFEETNDFGLVSVSGTTASTLADYNALKTELAAVTATGVNSASYTPTNTAVRSCPTVGANWNAASALPPTPNAQLCSCMTASLSCSAKSTIPDASLAAAFGIVCGLNSGKACLGIQRNTTTGTYGAYGMCTGQQQLSFAYDAYYKSQNKAASACDFGGLASVLSPSTASGTCSVLLAQAGVSGTGVVSSSPSATGSSSASSSKAAAAGTYGGNPFSMGGVLGAAYIVGAIVAGAGMILL